MNMIDYILKVAEREIIVCWLRNLTEAGLALGLLVDWAMTAHISIRLSNNSDY